MIQLLSLLIGNPVSTLDGPAGIAKDFFFEDDTWAVKYLVCGFPGWNPPEPVLVPVSELLLKEWDLPILSVSTRKDALRQYPPVHTDPPVSLQKMDNLRRIWPDPIASGTAFPSSYQTLGEVTQGLNPNLRSFRAVRHYQIGSSRRIVGTCQDFAMDEKNGTILSLIVRLRRWFARRSVIVPPHWVSQVDWANGILWTEKHLIDWEGAPEFSPGRLPRIDDPRQEPS